MRRTLGPTYWIDPQERKERVVLKRIADNYPIATFTVKAHGSLLLATITAMLHGMKIEHLRGRNLI